MALGSSSRTSRKTDLIVRINLERLHQGGQYAEVVSQAQRLWRMKIKELEDLYGALLSQRDAKGERKERDK